MAVYTDVVAEDLGAFLAGYDIGELLSYKGIAEGVENSNFLVHTSRGYFILTLYERRVAAKDLPFFLGLMEHLHARGISCPQPVKNKRGEVLGQVAGRPAAMITFLDGMWIRRPSPAHCARARRGAGAAASRRARFQAQPRQRAFGRGLAAALRELQRAGERGAARLAAISRRRAFASRRRRGRANCRKASSTPTCFPTTCSSSATSCPA